MTNIGNLIDPDITQKMNTVVAHLDPDDAAKTVHKGEIRVVKAATDPNPPRPLTRADAVVIPPGMTTRFEAKCVDCGCTVWLSPTLPDGTDPSIPRVPICAKHAEERCVYAAVVEQRRVEVIRRNEQAHQASLNKLNKKEKPVIDLNTIPDATVGQAVKASIKAEKVAKVKKDRPKAKAKQKKAEQEARQRIQAEQADRKNLLFPAFKIDSVAVCPELDLSDKSLDEVVHAADRTHYNRARFRVLGEPSLDPETTTWRVLAEEHQRLAKAAKAKRKQRKAKGKTKQAKQATSNPQVIAEVDVTEQAKRLAAFTGVTVERAMELLG